MKVLRSSTRSPFVAKVQSHCALPRRSRMASRQVTRAEFETQIIMCASNACALALGRWGFLSYQRQSVQKAGLPVQNGITHEAAGDIRAKEASFLLDTKDPAGFTLIDVMAWGSIGHIIGFIILSTNSTLSVG